MKKILRYAFLVAAAMLSTAAMAEADVFGAIDKGWGDAGCNRQYTLTANQSITFDFVVNNTNKGGDWAGWSTLVRSAPWGEGTTEYFFMQCIGYAVTEGNWDDPSKNNNDGNTWFKYNRKNYDYEVWKDELIGAHVTLTITRVGKQIRYLADVRPTSGKTWGHYFVMETTNEDGIFVCLGADHAEIALNSHTIANYADPAVQGTLIGDVDNTTPGFARSSDYTLSPESTVTIDFINYGNRAENFFNWIFELQKGDKFLDLRPDNWGWGDYWTASNCFQTDYDWTTFKNDMYGASVKITASRTGNSLVVTAEQKSVNNKTFTETYKLTHDDFATGDATVRMMAEGAHLDILSGVVTGINTVKETAPAVKAVRYNVAGQQVSNAFKGMVIENGKKFLVK